MLPSHQPCTFTESVLLEYFPLKQQYVHCIVCSLCVIQHHSITLDKCVCSLSTHAGCISVPVISAGSYQAAGNTTGIQRSHRLPFYTSITFPLLHTHIHCKRMYVYANIPFSYNFIFFPSLSECKSRYSLVLSRSKKNKSKRIRSTTVSIATNPQTSLWQHTVGGGGQQRGQQAGQQVVVLFGVTLWDELIKALT